MDNEKLQYMLLQAAERLQDFANRLSPGGKPLTHSERQVCRAALVPILSEAFTCALADYVIGNGTRQILDSIENQLRDIEIV